MPRKTSKRPSGSKKTDRNSISGAVAKLRRQQNLTQEDLAGRAASAGWNISRDVVKRIERGEREVTDVELRRLATALRVPISVLFD